MEWNNKLKVINGRRKYQELKEDKERADWVEKIIEDELESIQPINFYDEFVDKVKEN